LCIGESVRDDKGNYLNTLQEQLEKDLAGFPVKLADRLIIAYEPVWAIGTGRTPSTDDVTEMHAAIRAQLIDLLEEEGKGVRILYGGSVKASNADELLHVPDVDGALVGGASLKAADFVPIIEAGAR
jgi:triosephosphate isomerase